MHRSSKAYIELTDVYPITNIPNLVSGNPSINASFETSFHPHLATFITVLNSKGISGLLTMDNQTLGNPYLHSPWKFSHNISNASTGPASFIEGGWSKEMPMEDKAVRPGDFEAVVLEGNSLIYYRHDNSDGASDWHRDVSITNNALSPGCITERYMGRVYQQGKVVRPGDFGIVILERDGLHYYSKDNSISNSPIVDKGIITSQATDAGCIIESYYYGNISTPYTALEVVVPEAGQNGKKQLIHYKLENNTTIWQKQGIITDKSTGPASIIQSTFLSGDRPRFDLVVLEGSNLVHYSKDNNNEWHQEAIITEAATTAGCIIESRIQDSWLHGNFEVVVCEGNQLIHYWKDNSDVASTWKRGQVITTKAIGAGCIVHGSFNIVGNFEVIVPEVDGKLVHYYNVNEGMPGDEGERFYFKREYGPTANVYDPYPRHYVDFSNYGSYSQYNWEIFFHLPMLLATRLSANQRFADAMQWYHYIFNPTDDSHEMTTHRYWKFLPFRDSGKERIDHMLATLADTSKGSSREREEIQAELSDWYKNPAQPHRIARHRLIPYKKNVVMKYIDNIINWGDQLFRQDTIESINEATQLYILASDLLGPRPRNVPQRGKIRPQTYAQLRPKLHEFGIAKQEIENEFPFAGQVKPLTKSDETTGLLGLGDSLYFCIPQNNDLLGYWDLAEDRLYKIRHCMNIEGIVRQLPLFEPPIPPGLLVRAAAKGIDLASVLSDLSAPLPMYRFSYIFQKAFEICSELKSFGSMLLSILEKKDAEELSTIRAGHEVEMLNLVRNVKDQQMKEAQAAMIALSSSRKLAVTRYLHYQTLLGVEDPKEPKQDEEIQEYVPSGNFRLENGEEGVRLMAQEKAELDLADKASDFQSQAGNLDIAANLAHLIPAFYADFAFWGMGAHIGFGGNEIGSALSAVARASQMSAGQISNYATKISKITSLVLREREWALQNNLAAKEIMQIDKQLAAAEIRIAITQHELDNHDKQIEQGKFIEEFLHNKYTNEELYTWMQGEISTIYFQCYQLAYNLAKQAEACYRFETGIFDSNFIQFGYWDSLRKGLLAGERLYFALKQMEKAYHEHNKREYELTKNVSLMFLNPAALIMLKETGQCTVDLPESLFDADYSGHYMRRIKNVSLTVPCIIGPYANINCTMTLLSNKLRISNNAQTEYPEQEDDPRFLTNLVPMQSIATSHGQNDSGMFELNFRDERYLPFEGVGVISRWRIDMPRQNNSFDFNTISDVIIRLNYTARDGGELLKKMAREWTFADPQENIIRIFSMKHEFPNEWYHFFNPTNQDLPDSYLEFMLTQERFPYQLHGKVLTINKLELFLNFKNAENTIYSRGSNLKISLQDWTNSAELRSNPMYGGMPYLLASSDSEPSLSEISIPAPITITAKEDDIRQIAKDLQTTIGEHQRLNIEIISDLFLICHYTASEPKGS